MAQVNQEIARLRSEVEQLKRGDPPQWPKVNIEAGSDVFEVPVQTDTGKLREQQRREVAGYIAETMEDAYSLEDLRDLYFAFDIDFDSVSGGRKRDKVRALVKHFYHRNTLRVLVEFLESDRPNRVWRVRRESS